MPKTNIEMLKAYTILSNNPGLKGAIIELQEHFLKNSYGEKKSKILSYYLSGFSVIQIAKIFDIPHQQVTCTITKFKKNK